MPIHSAVAKERQMKGTLLGPLAGITQFNTPYKLEFSREAIMDILMIRPVYMLFKLANLRAMSYSTSILL
jgi:hypothetical protein